MLATDLNQTYEAYQNNFNMAAEQSGLQVEITSYLTAIAAADNFDASPYLKHGVIDLVSMLIPVVNFDVAHRIMDHDNDQKNFYANKALKQQQTVVSAKLVNTLKMLGSPSNYAEAVAVQKILLNINPHFLDSMHYEEFKALRGAVEMEMHKYGHQHMDDSQTQLKQRQDQLMDKMQAVEIMQHGLGNAVVEGQSQIQDLLQHLQQHGIEISDQLINGLMQNQLIQKDVRTIIAYLENAQMEKIRQQQHEIKMANYQGLSDACCFTAELGNLVGSRDLVRVAQIAQASIKIHQTIDQLLDSSFIGTAIISPYVAIGMAILKVFSLFQKSNNPHAMVMKQLANISRQINALHKEVLQQFGRVDEKLNTLLARMLEGFKNLQLSLHVNVETKLLQIQSEITTLTNITKTGFEALLLQNLKDYIQHIDDFNRGAIKSSLSQNKYEKWMGGLVGFITENATHPLFNGMVYKHLLENNRGSTQQIIEIVSQTPISILHGLLGLLIDFAKNTLKVGELQQISPEKMVHPGLWQLGLQAYFDMQHIYKTKYTYDPNGVHLDTFRYQTHLLAQIIKVFSSNASLYEIILTQLQRCHDSIKASIATVTAPEHTQPQLSRLIYDIPEKLKNSDKIKCINQQFFQLENLIKVLAQHNKAIPEVFFNAERLGLGYLEFQVHLPNSVRSREHHGGFGINKGEKTGLEVTFVMESQRIALFIPQLSEKYHNKKLKEFYSYIFKVHSKISYTPATIEYINQAIHQHSTDAKKKIALSIAARLQDNSDYHQLLKLNHFLIAYLIYGGFSEAIIQNIKACLLLENIADKFASFAQSHLSHIELPVIQIAGAIELEQLKKIIFAEINQPKSSMLAANLHCGMLLLDKLEIARNATGVKLIEIGHKPGQTYGEFLSAKPAQVQNNKPNLTNTTGEQFTAHKL